MSTIDKNLTSFIDVAQDSDFSIHNLPYGIFSETADGQRRAGIAIGEQVLDLSVLESEGLLNLDGGPYFDQSTLNAFIDSGRDNWTTARKTIQTLLSLVTAIACATYVIMQICRKKRYSSKQTSPCTYRCKCLALPTFILLKSTPPTSVLCSVTQVTPYCLTGLKCLSAITVAPVPSSVVATM